MMMHLISLQMFQTEMRERRSQLEPISVKDGSWDIWLPSGALRNAQTSFIHASPDITLTIPSTAQNVISVGAYDSRTNRTAAFSGRGYTWAFDSIKPDIIAPGVDIISCSNTGGYTSKTGTSMAAPFVTGAAALLMEWGIVRGNDLYMYGDKLKASLIKGAGENVFTTASRAVSENTSKNTKYPNPVTGWRERLSTMLTSLCRGRLELRAYISF